ncbi:hypothetical protein [Helicobacter turcicus]|uniref:Poly E-rich protein n=1 Tax=Helicobacter turcicus TaxID=2867412 RepID=A0ABS7JPR5_9HELI|nr:hypothetical protein [Helicobacter turcicus]MBX7491383.1 hypothetical protein [Helicobacter turcicus]MBX7546250.1 hypothetical protein [Helicobacter turcicus]
MKLYLINKNPIINKLVALSASKLSVEMVESQEIDTSISAELVLIDDECFDVESFTSYKAEHTTAKMILFYSKATERIDGFDTYIQKPFLPTDLVNTLSEISGISVEDTSKKGVESDILELESNDDLGKLNLDDALDFSNLEDLNLDKKLDDDGDTQLDFGGDDGLEGLEDNAKFAKTEDTLDSLGDEGKSEDLQVLDKDDVDTIKDLLDDSKEAVAEDSSLDFDLDKELEGITDSTEEEGIELASSKTDNVEQELETAEQKEESQEATLEAMEGFDNVADSTDSALDTENNFDFNLDDIASLDSNVAESQSEETSENAEFKSEESKSTEAAESENADFELDLEDLNKESNLEDSTNKANAESDVANDDLAEFDLENFNLEDTNKEENIESNIEATNETLENEAQDEGTDEAILEMQNGESETSKDVGLETDSTTDFGENLDLGADLEIEPKMDSQIESKAELEIDPEVELEEPKVELKTDSTTSTNGSDDFDTLSLEEMGEALGEPIQKEPIPTPIVTKDTPAQEMQLPSSIQANSLESLIGALQTLQTQTLKELLSGATININIQFPKKDDK